MYLPFWLVIIFLFFQGHLLAQNLVPNPDFEYYDVCPQNYHNAGEPLECVPWSAANLGSPDYYNACCDNCAVDVPDNIGGYQDARSGYGYAGLYTAIPNNKREYIKAPLISPLIAGVRYYVEFYVSPNEFACSAKPIGALFTVDPPIYGGEQVLQYTPQIQVNGDYLDDYANWTLVSGCFIANGGESYITIGNFLDDDETELNVCSPPMTADRAYYFIEDVVVIPGPVDELIFELGDPVSECFSYTIDASFPNVTYHWEDGSTQSTLTVFESGTYSVTISDGCLVAVDSLEVEILGNIPVSLPDDQVSLCYPESYQIELDPDAGSYSWSNGISGPNITITQGGIYEVELDDGCATSTDQVEVIIVQEPAPFTLGNDIILCPNEEITYTFDPAIGDFLWQDGDTDASYTIFQGGTYSLTISNACGVAFDEVEVTLLNIPEIELGDPLQFICNGESIYFSFDQDQGDYLWQNGSVEAEFEILEAGQYSVMVNNECGIASDELTVQEQSIPSPTLGTDQLLCEGQSILLSSPDDNGTYVWQDQSTGTEFLVTASGTYSVTISNECGIGTDSVVVDFIPALGLLELGNDIILCPGESVVLDPGIENANYVWQDFSTADTFFINQAGQYSVTVSDQCTSYADTVNVVVENDPPVVDLIDQVSLCEGSSITLAAGISGANYLWSDGSTQSELVITNPGTYALTVSNACGVDADTVNVTDGGSSPFVSLGNDVSFCPGEEVLLTPANQNVNSWLWSDGSTGQTLLVSDGGIVSLEVSNACGTSTDTLIATLFEPTPTFNLGADTSICPGESIIIQPDIIGISLVWSDGSQSEHLEITFQGIYHATLSGACGISSDTIQISVLPQAPELDLGADQSLCPGEIISINPGIADVNYTWHDGSDQETFTTTQPGEIILTISNTCGQDIDTLIIIESTEGPQVHLGPDVIGCAGDTITLNAGISGVDYVWQDGSTNSNIDVFNSGEYILQVSNNCGVDSDTIQVDISGQVPQATLGRDTLLCEGDKLILTADAQSGTVINWQDQSSLPQFEVVEAGLYILDVSNHCGSSIDSIIVSYLDGPVDVDLGKDTVLCPGESIVLVAPLTTDDLTWQDGSEENTFIAIAGQLYSLIISNVCGTKRDEIFIAADNRIPVTNLDDEYPLCPDEIVTLDVTQTFTASYLWNTGSTQPSVEIKQPGEYAVTIFTPCQDLTEDVTIVIGEDCLPRDIYIPNVFSPNGDGINDVFEVNLHPKLEVHSLHGTIYDRWGNVLYESTGHTFSWNGNFDQRPMMPGVYVFRMEIEYIINGKEEKEIRVGDVNLIR